MKKTGFHMEQRQKMTVYYSWVEPYAPEIRL